MHIELFDFEELFEGISAAEMPETPMVECLVRKCRCGDKRKPDYATGFLVARMDSTIGAIEFGIRWQAEGQSNPEDGWIIRESPSLKGGYIKTPIPVQDDTLVLLPDSAELVSLAYDFWTCRDIDEHIEPHLPVRQETQFLGEARRDNFSVFELPPKAWRRRRQLARRKKRARVQ